jgi:hypothetical protein
VSCSPIARGGGGIVGVTFGIGFFGSGFGSGTSFGSGGASSIAISSPYAIATALDRVMSHDASIDACSAPVLTTISRTSGRLVAHGSA